MNFVAESLDIVVNMFSFPAYWIKFWRFWRRRHNLKSLVLPVHFIFIEQIFFRDKYILRFAVCSRFTVSSDIEFAWQEILRNLDLISVNQDPEK